MLGRRKFLGAAAGAVAAGPAMAKAAAMDTPAAMGISSMTGGMLSQDAGCGPERYNPIPGAEKAIAELQARLVARKAAAAIGLPDIIGDMAIAETTYYSRHGNPSAATACLKSVSLTGKLNIERRREIARYHERYRAGLDIIEMINSERRRMLHLKEQMT